MNRSTSMLTSVLLRPALALLLAILLNPMGGTSLLAASESSDQSAELPAAETILDRYVQVTGGREAHDRIHNRVTHGTFEMVNQGISGDITVYSARPNLLYASIRTEAAGTIEQGTDGETAWEKSAMTGPIIKQGQERIDMLRNATFDRMVNWRKVFASAETTGQETLDGTVCDVVSLTPAEGEPQTLYFARDSGLLVRLDTVMETQMGALAVKTRMGDYRTVDDIAMPAEVRMTVMGQERRIVTSEVEHNVDMASDRFALPEDVKALRDQQAGGGR